jgi:hypothetical protein
MVLRPSPLLIAAGMMLGSTLALVGYPGGMQAAYEDARDLSELQSSMDEDEAFQKEIEQKSAVVLKRVSTKCALVQELIQGRTTLAEVTRRFHEMNAESQPCMCIIRSRYPNIPDEERMALNVIEFVSLEDLPSDQMASVKARLNDEFQHMFGHQMSPVY